MAEMPTSKPLPSFDAQGWVANPRYVKSTLVSSGDGKIDGYPGVDLRYKIAWGNSDQYLIRLETRIFNCCGATGIEHMGQRLDYVYYKGTRRYYLDGEDLENLKQEFLYAVVRANQYVSYESWDLNSAPDLMWMVTSEENGAQRVTPHTFLKSLGAKRVDSFKNRVHGPAILEVYRWNAADHMEQVRKYIHFNTDKSFIPLYAKEAWDEQQQRANHATKPAPVASQAQDPIDGRPVRDAGIWNFQSVFGAGIQQLVPSQDLPQQAHAANGGDNPFGNPTFA